MMDFHNLPWDASAVVLWLPEGEEPGGAKHFNVEADMSPPNPNPEAWWTLGDALLDIRATERLHDKLPWVKVGDIVIRPEQVLSAYEAFKIGRR